jgi:glycosyltransferase involved in cell wall biosynthesis
MIEPDQRTVLIANPGTDLYGSDRMMLETVSALSNQGWRVVVTVPRDGPLVEGIRARGARVEFCPTVLWRKSAMSPLGVLRLLSEIARSVRPSLSLIRRVDPDVIYVNTITPLLWFVLARLTRRPSVGHIHEGEASAARIVLRVINAPLLLANAIIANSEFSVGVMAGAFSRLARKSTVVYNTVAGPARLVPARAHLVGALRVGYVGRLSARKGPDVAVRAMGRLRDQGVDARLDLVGAVFPGYEWYHDELIELIRTLDVGDRVQLHGFHADPWPFTEQADVVVVPSVGEEGFGNTAVEALLAGRPLVVSAMSGLTEAVAGFDAVVPVAAGDAEELAAGLKEVRDRWEWFREHALADAARASSRYSADAYGHQLSTILAGMGARPERFHRAPT